MKIESVAIRIFKYNGDNFLIKKKNIISLNIVRSTEIKNNAGQLVLWDKDQNIESGDGLLMFYSLNGTSFFMMHGRVTAIETTMRRGKRQKNIYFEDWVANTLENTISDTIVKNAENEEEIVVNLIEDSGLSQQIDTSPINLNAPALASPMTYDARATIEGKTLAEQIKTLTEISGKVLTIMEDDKINFQKLGTTNSGIIVDGKKAIEIRYGTMLKDEIRNDITLYNGYRMDGGMAVGDYYTQLTNGGSYDLTGNKILQYYFTLPGSTTTQAFARWLVFQINQSNNVRLRLLIHKRELDGTWPPWTDFTWFACKFMQTFQVGNLPVGEDIFVDLQDKIKADLGSGETYGTFLETAFRVTFVLEDTTDTDNTINIAVDNTTDNNAYGMVRGHKPTKYRTYDQPSIDRFGDRPFVKYYNEITETEMKQVADAILAMYKDLPVILKIKHGIPELLGLKTGETATINIDGNPVEVALIQREIKISGLAEMEVMDTFTTRILSKIPDVDTE